MTHEELRDRLLDLACGELSPRDAREVEEHAASCEPCRAELASMRGTRRVMAALPVEPAPERGERLLVAAAREAARARTPRRAWPRWLWVAPVAAASLATVVAVSLRLEVPRPPDAAHEDRDALRGESPYAVPLAPPSPRAELAAPAPASPAPTTDEAKGALAERAEPPRAAAKKAEAPRQPAAEPRFAAAPDEAPAPSQDRARAAPSASAAPPAAPPPSVAYAAPPQTAAPTPARRAAKAMAAPEERDAAGAAVVVAPRERAVAAARVRADQLGVDTAGADVQVGAEPVTWDAWRAQGPALRSAPAALNGRRFWLVTFSRLGTGRALTVFVEDGTFRPLAELQDE